MVPWTKGTHPDYSAFVIEVHVRKDAETGALRSLHRLQDEQDVEVTATLTPSGGMAEGSWALLTEAIRAEALLQLLLKLSNDAEFKEKMESAEEVPEDFIENLSKSALQQVQRGLNELASPLAHEAISAVHDGLRNQTE